MGFSALLLSRIQFGFTIGFHILFPTLNIGLAFFLSIMEGLWLKTGKPEYLQICKFWLKVFALTFGMGVVSGVVLSYELGTNFSRFIAAAGSVLGPLFAYEVLTAFFMEAGFLGIMLFGWDKVGPKLHYSATILVALGTTISAFWIMSANSWMQTPAGYHIVDNKFIVDSWWQVVFNPSFIPRFLHMVMASYVTCCFFIAGISAWYLLKNRHYAFAKCCLSFSLSAAILLTPLQILLGDVVGVNAHHHQPLKTAAMEGLWDTTKGAPLVLFAIPNLKAEKNHYQISVPYGASLINTHDLHGELQGLKSVALAERPIVVPVFFGFRIMVGIGLLFLAVALCGLWLRRRQCLYTTNWFLRVCVLLTPLGFISTIAGWITSESGRQPWIIYHLLYTRDAASPITSHQVMTSLSLFFIIYTLVFLAYLYYLVQVIVKGPQSSDLDLKTTGAEIPQLFPYMATDNIREDV